ncbi:hypothetical protein [Microvirga calopogonii]|nr:hypothetical protein [Microvirga calopogonii]
MGAHTGDFRGAKTLIQWECRAGGTPSSGGSLMVFRKVGFGAT